MTKEEKKVEYDKLYYQNNKEKKHKSARKWALKNLKKVCAYNKLYYQNNKEELLKKFQKYYQTINGKANSRTQNIKRRARKKNAEGYYTTEDIKNMYAAQGARCYYCSISIEDKYHIEHMTPLSRGGSNWIDNICLACVRCNLSKHTKTSEEFLACSFN